MSDNAAEPQSKILGFVEQPDARTCQSAAIAKVFGTLDVAWVRGELDKIAAKRGSIAGDPFVMSEFMKGSISSYLFDDNATLNDIRRALDDGAVVITHGWFTRSGHVLTIVGYEPDPNTLSYRFIVDDPWYEFDFPMWRYSTRSGDNVRYSSYGMYAAIVASAEAAHAHRIYLRGELNSDRKGAWVHICKN